MPRAKQLEEYLKHEIFSFFPKLNDEAPPMETAALIKIQNGIIFREGHTNYAIEFTSGGNLSAFFAQTDRVPNRDWKIEKKRDENPFQWTLAGGESKMILHGKNTTAEMVPLAEDCILPLYEKIIFSIGVHQIREEKITLSVGDDHEIYSLFHYKQKKIEKHAAEKIEEDRQKK